MRPITVAVVAGRTLFREALVTWLGAQFVPVEVVASAGTVAALRGGCGWAAQIVLLDDDLGDGSQIEDNVQALLAGGSAVIAMGQAEADPRRRALDVGAVGWVSTGDTGNCLVQVILSLSVHGREARMTDLVTPARAIVSGIPRLSTQERRALRFYAAGLPLKSVARQIGVSEGSAKSYLDRVRAKYAGCGRPAPTKMDLFRRASEDGLLAEG